MSKEFGESLTEHLAPPVGAKTADFAKIKLSVAACFLTPTLFKEHE